MYKIHNNVKCNKGLPCHPPNSNHNLIRREMEVGKGLLKTVGLATNDSVTFSWHY